MLQMDYAMSKQHFSMRYFFNFVPRMPRTIACSPAPLHAPALSESDKQVWKVSLHHLR